MIDLKNNNKNRAHLWIWDLLVILKMYTSIPSTLAGGL